MTNQEETLTKEVLFGDEARQEMLKGVNILADAVESTLGPKGKNVVIQQQDRKYILTKDGVTVAKYINLNNQYQDAGAQIVKEVSARTNDMAGDGTTTATTLARNLFSGGMKLLAGGYSAAEIKLGMEYASQQVISFLKENSLEVKDSKVVANIGTISANGEVEIGNLLAEAMEEVGPDGVISIEKAKGIKTSLTFVEGVKYDRGYTSPYFATDTSKGICELDNPYIFISNLKFNSINDFLPLLEELNRENKSILIIADEVEGDLLKTLIQNHTRGTLKCCVIKAPSFGEHRLNLLNDLGVLTGGKVITAADKLGKDLIEKGVLGKCKKVVVSKSEVSIIGSYGSQEEIDKQVMSLKKKAEHHLELDEKEMNKERISKLSSSVAILNVGGSTDLELEERLYRVEDALNATSAAVEEGVVPGGGVALLKSSEVLNNLELPKKSTESFKQGILLVKNACEAPFHKIIKNGDTANSILVKQKLLDGDFFKGYNAYTDEFIDSLEGGVIDPVKVTRSALENAVSVTSLLLTVDACVLNTVENNELNLGL